ncbi:4-hydroxybenzoate polyprenyltransferase, mitochondrial-like [Antedon mediterranea]|uniref:4-hydroxybenzoate polyprenyltransferase, mitochondrial-like n=1 Tax=Antedon mediterranea TaxID=105859 RepID=UPI003AF472F9
MNLLCKRFPPIYYKGSQGILLTIINDVISNTRSTTTHVISTRKKKDCDIPTKCLNYSHTTKQSCHTFSQRSSSNYLLKNCSNYFKLNKFSSQFNRTLIFRNQLERLSYGVHSCQQERNISFKTTSSAIVDAMPSKTQPYLRLIRFDKPIGTWLIYLPCAWSIAMAANPGSFPSFYYLGVCGLGALLMRGAGCTINDMWDKDFDKSVARTRTRPIASGQISRFQALVFLGAQLSATLAILSTFNTYSIIIGASSMALVVTYPLMKRITFWPQAFLGLAMNWGILVGWSAIQGSCDWSVVLPLFASGICWTIVYDTIYGHQDKSDDLTLGLKSTSILMGDKTKYWLSGFGTTMIGNLLLAGYMCDQTLPYYLAVGLVAGHLSSQIWTLDINDPDDCWKKFSSNKRIGLILLAGIIAGTLGQVDKEETKEKTQ